MKSTWKATCLGVLVLAASSVTRADGFALGARLSTLGYGVEIDTALSERTALVLGVNGYNYDFSGTESGNHYNIDAKLRTAGLGINWYPLNGGFHLSAGAYYNDTTYELTASGNLNINNTTYPTTAKGEVSFDKFSPYVGLGWGRPSRQGENFAFTFDLGLMYQGNPDVTLTAPGVSASDLAAEEQQLEDELSDFKYYPIISFLFSYKF